MTVGDHTPLTLCALSALFGQRVHTEVFRCSHILQTVHVSQQETLYRVCSVANLSGDAAWHHPGAAIKTFVDRLILRIEDDSTGSGSVATVVPSDVTTVEWITWNKSLKHIAHVYILQFTPPGKADFGMRADAIMRSVL